MNAWQWNVYALRLRLRLRARQVWHLAAAGWYGMQMVLVWTGVGFLRLIRRALLAITP